MPSETTKSALVCNTTPVAFPGFRTPMVRPESVTVTAVLAASAPLRTVTTIDVAADGAAEATAGLPLTATLLATTPAAKKPAGYVTVMLPPAVNAPPTVGVKLNVADEPAFPATRSLAASKNDVFVTW